MTGVRCMAAVRCMTGGFMATAAEGICAPGVGLSEDGMAIARHDLPRLESIPECLRDRLLRGGLVHQVPAEGTLEYSSLLARCQTRSEAEIALLLELLQPDQHLLVGKAVQRASETVHTCAAALCSAASRRDRRSSFQTSGQERRRRKPTQRFSKRWNGPGLWLARIPAESER